MTSIFYSETKSIIAMPGKATHLIIFPANSSEFWDAFSLARAFPPPSKRNCLCDLQFLKDNDGCVHSRIFRVTSLICSHSWRPMPWVICQLSSACVEAVYFTPWQLLQAEGDRSFDLNANYQTPNSLKQRPKLTWTEDTTEINLLLTFYLGWD